MSSPTYTSIPPSSGKLIIMLERLFQLLNDHFFDGKLEKPVIVTSARGRHRRDCILTEERNWKQLVPGTAGGGEQYFQLWICAEILSSTVEPVAHAMLAELVHLYCVMHGIKDSTRKGTYRTRKYKEVAETHGLIALQTPKNGFFETQLTTDAKDFISGLIMIQLELSYEEPATTVSAKKKTDKKLRYICPSCSTVILAFEPISVNCNRCHKAFQLDT